MNIYVDDNLADKALTALLKKAGHSVVRPIEVGLDGRSDASHLTHAIDKSLAFLTSNRDDFRDLHFLIRTAGGSHPGIMVVRFDNDTTRDMRPKHIVGAVGKLERSGIPLGNELVTLNHWR
jgi:predicted nuclease of predicted toxin-antitoxin system